MLELILNTIRGSKEITLDINGKDIDILIEDIEMNLRENSIEFNNSIISISSEDYDEVVFAIAERLSMAMINDIIIEMYGWEREVEMPYKNKTRIYNLLRELIDDGIHYTIECFDSVLDKIEGEQYEENY